MLIRRSLRAVRRLAAARTAVAGVEFAVVVPLMLIMLAGVADLGLAIIMAGRLSAAAGDVALIASTMAVQSSNPNALTAVQAWQATTAPFALFPAWRGAGAGDFSITLSAVDFTATKGGGWQAKTSWSVANPLGSPTLRPCGTLAAVADTATPSMTTLPRGAFGATTVLVGDVKATFVPAFTSVFVGPLTLARSAYVSPRLNNGVALSGVGAGVSVVCPKPSA